MASGLLLHLWSGSAFFNGGYTVWLKEMVAESMCLACNTALNFLFHIEEYQMELKSQEISIKIIVNFAFISDPLL